MAGWGWGLGRAPASQYVSIKYMTMEPFTFRNQSRSAKRGGFTPINRAGGLYFGVRDINVYNAVPEPSSMVLAGLGAVSLLAFRRRS